MTLLKGIVLLLALANVGFYLWARGIAGEPAAPGEPVRAPTLKLAAEVPVPPRGGADAHGAPSTGSGGETAASDAGAAAAASGAAAAAARPDSAPAGDGHAAGSEAIVAASTPASGSPPPDAAAAPPSDVKRCLTVGPFRDVAEAARAAATLRGGGYEPRQRVAEGEVWAGVWVYLGVPPTRPGVDQMLAKLRSGGIDDALEMPGPQDTPVISLGLFSEPKRAQARLAQAQALGFNPGVADRKRNGDVYWIDIDLKATDSMINAADLQGDSKRIMRLQVAACPVSPS